MQTLLGTNWLRTWCTARNAAPRPGRGLGASAASGRTPEKSWTHASCRRHLHPGGLPLDERLIAWDLVKAEREGNPLEVSDAVREVVDRVRGPQRVAAAEPSIPTNCRPGPDLPQEVIADVFQSLSVEEGKTAGGDVPRTIRWAPSWTSTRSPCGKT